MSSELIIYKWRLNYSKNKLEHERELEKVYMKPPLVPLVSLVDLVNFNIGLTVFSWENIKIS